MYRRLVHRGLQTITIGVARNAWRSNDKGATRAPLRTVAERTGLEPATSGVTGQHSNQLNYHSAFFWWVL